MHSSPLVTVICLCFNHEKFVVEALESVLFQTHQNVELIIADDFSTDNSVQVIEQWLKKNPEIKFLVNKKNLGNTKTFNQCLKLSKGEYIIDLAADDILKPDCIASQLRGFATTKYENIGLIYGNAELINENGGFISYYFKTDGNKKRIQSQPTGNIYIGLLNGDNNVCSISSLVKREVFKKLDGYDENLAYEDYDLWIRASRTYNFDYIDEILIQKRVLSNSMYTLLFKKNNRKTQQFNYSTYLILKKVYVLNQNKREFVAMLKRIHFEMTVAFKTRDFNLLKKYIIMELNVRWKIIRF
ncbi:glycosyltransferase involved in cell wall biosynthesis [Flavobacterium sp. PL11]|jgi:glycosyltransferase involved in cell wall biosynthesis|uniref:glycosyltransferase family 2 protein n=1 Tax=Flavobacterium sp. PL11 TaxID=3071717 RepID=UPI002DFED04D|nr:glycosyltransferase involved in cell wall biosynthesis [Flavobacterium sp. PL11]